MRFLLSPELLFERFDELTPAYLHRKGIRLLLCDLDNTLALHETARPTDEVRAWVKSLTEAGIGVMIVSNNRSPKRVEAYCHDLGIPYVGHAGKPKRGKMLSAMARFGATPQETALLGDQIFTDVLGANRCHFHSYCIEPLCGRDSLWHWTAYWLQNPFRLSARRRRKSEKKTCP
jgi:hypothetical protein